MCLRPPRPCLVSFLSQYRMYTVGEKELLELNKFLSGYGNLSKYKSPIPLSILAVTIGDLRVLQLLIDKGIDLDCRDSAGNTALHLSAIDTKKNALLCLLLASGAGQFPNQEGKLPVDLAIEADVKNNVQSLIDSMGNPVIFAIQKGRVELLKWLLAEPGGRFTLNVMDRYENGPVLVAAMYGQVDMLKWLTKSQAEGGGGLTLAVRNPEGMMPIDFAIFFNQPIAVNYLFDQHLNLNKPAANNVQVIKGVIAFGKKYQDHNKIEFEPKLLAHWEACLEYYIREKNADSAVRVYRAYNNQATDIEVTCWLAKNYHIWHGEFDEAYYLYEKLLENSKVSEELKETIRYEIANLIFCGYLDISIAGGPFVPGVACRKIDDKCTDKEKEEILTARAIQAACTLGENEGESSNDFRRRIDCSLARAYSPEFFAVADQKPWRKEVTILFAAYCLALDLKIPSAYRERVLDGVKIHLYHDHDHELSGGASVASHL